MISQSIVASIFVVVFVSVVELLFIVDGCDRGDLSVFNPVENYRRWTNLNWFGVILFTFLLNVICPGLSVCYWFWKLCTVGRKG